LSLSPFHLSFLSLSLPSPLSFSVPSLILSFYFSIQSFFHYVSFLTLCMFVCFSMQFSFLHLYLSQHISLFLYPSH
jgi:hypothetical protein